VIFDHWLTDWLPGLNGFGCLIDRVSVTCYFGLLICLELIPVAALSHVSAVIFLLGMRVRISPGSGVSLVSVVKCQVEVSATGRSLG
jgi:hypothetical protein